MARALHAVAGDESDLRALVPSWNLAMRSSRAPKTTMALYNRGVASYFEWCDRTGERPALSRGQIQTYLIDLMEKVGRQPSTASAYLKGIKAFAKWCHEEGELADNQTVKVAAPAVDDKYRAPVTPEQHAALLATCDDSFSGRRDRALLLLLRDCGGRGSEVCGLELEDVHISEGFAVIHGKGSRDRLVGFGNDTATALDRYVRIRRRHRQAASPNFWLGARTSSFGYTALWHMIERRCAQAGIEKLHPHMWRRMWANEFLDAGGSADGLKALAGWRSWVMVEHYTGQVANARALREQKRLRGE